MSIDYVRKQIEREIDAALHPKGMSTHSGKVTLQASHVQRLLVEIDAAQARIDDAVSDMNHYWEMSQRLESANDALKARVAELEKAADVERVFTTSLRKEQFVNQERIDALTAEVARLREAVNWVINDASYKPPEEIGDIPARWIARLGRALAQPTEQP